MLLQEEGQVGKMNGTVENLPISRFITPGLAFFYFYGAMPLAFVYRR